MADRTIASHPDGVRSDHLTLRAGQTVGRYIIGAVLGQGGFGITYRATDSQLGREVAIKEYLPAALAHRQEGTLVVPRSEGAAADFAWGRDRFVSEGRTLAALHHAPGIVQVHDFLEANGTAYLVMQLIPGQTLQYHLQGCATLDAAAVQKLLEPLLDGLDRVHAEGFLHRDIKPANILLDASGHPTLIDFGAARAAAGNRSQSLTAIFSPGYAAVEQFTAAPQGPWTDIYGLSATLHHAITGGPPPNAVDRVLDDTYSPLAFSDRPYPRGLLEGIDSGLAVRAANRPQSIAEWRKLIDRSDYSADATVLIRPPSIALQKPPAARPVRFLLGGGAALATLALALGYAVFRDTSSAPANVTPVGPQVDDKAAGNGKEVPDQGRQKQEQDARELARLRAEAEARRQTDETAALRRQIEEEVRQKAEQEAASHRLAEQDAKQKADLESAARLKALEADKKGAEAEETGLQLTQPERQKIQEALTALGYGSATADGLLGPRSREMIAAWQRKTGRAATGYLAATQQAAMLRDAAAALSRFDDGQKKLEEVRRKQDEATEALARTPNVRPPPLPPNPGPSGNQCEGTFRSQWCRGDFEGYSGDCWFATMTVQNGKVSDGWSPKANPNAHNVVNGSIDKSGAVQLVFDGIGQQTYTNRSFTARLSGSVTNGVLSASGRAGANGREFSVRVQCK